MRIGPEIWHWVSTDTPGVPTGGMYGDVQAFEELIYPYGFMLAWSQLHECFCMYEERGDGRIVDHFHFLTTQLKPIPMTEDWLDVFLYLRETKPNIPVVEALAKLDAEQAYLAQCEADAEMEALRQPVMDRLDFGQRGRRPMITVPGLN